MTVPPLAGRRPVSAAVYAEIQMFYAHQMPLLEERRVEEFAATFTEDGVYAHAKDGWEMTGRESLVREIRASLPHYGTSIFRHWFDKMTVETMTGEEAAGGPEGEDAYRVTFRSLVSITDEQGKVTFEPSATVWDELVRDGERLLTRRRVVRHDIPDPAGYWDEKLGDERHG